MRKPRSIIGVGRGGEDSFYFPYQQPGNLASATRFALYHHMMMRLELDGRSWGRIEWRAGLIALSLSGCTLDFSDRPTGAASTSGSGGASSSASGATNATGASTSGAGGGAPLSPFFRDGSRLKANYEDFGGGVQKYLSFYDTTLGVDCDFKSLSTGDACVPQPPDLVQVGPSFSNSNCTVALAQASTATTACKVPRYAALQSTAVSCSLPTTQGTAGNVGYDAIFPIAGIFSGTQIYQKGINGCAVVPMDAGTQYYSLGDPLKLADLVTATRVIEPRGENLNEEVFQGSDGSWLLSRAFAGDSYCYPRANGGNELCLSVFNGFAPSIAPTISYYMSTDCSGPTFTPDFASVRYLCKPPDLLRQSSEDAQLCNLPDKYFAVGADAGLPVGSSLNTGFCSAFSNVNIQTSYKLGAELPSGTVPVLNANTIGNSRIQGTYYGSADGGAVTQLGFLSYMFADTMTGKPCDRVAFDDGTNRCVERALPLQYASQFSDATCSTPVFIVAAPTCGATQIIPGVGLVAPQATCPNQSGANASGLVTLVPYSGPVYQHGGNGCSSFTVDPMAIVLTAGTSIQPAAYSEIKIVDQGAP